MQIKYRLFCKTVVNCLHLLLYVFMWLGLPFSVDKLLFTSGVCTWLGQSFSVDKSVTVVCIFCRINVTWAIIFVWQNVTAVYISCCITWLELSFAVDKLLLLFTYSSEFTRLGLSFSVDKMVLLLTSSVVLIRDLGNHSRLTKCYCCLNLLSY